MMMEEYCHPPSSRPSAQPPGLLRASSTKRARRAASLGAPASFCTRQARSSVARIAQRAISWAASTRAIGGRIVMQTSSCALPGSTRARVRARVRVSCDTARSVRLSERQRRRGLLNADSDGLPCRQRRAMTFRIRTRSRTLGNCSVLHHCVGPHGLSPGLDADALAPPRARSPRADVF